MIFRLVAVHCQMNRSVTTIMFAGLLCLPTTRPAAAQTERTGSWADVPAIIEGSVYLQEPWIISRSFQLSPTPN